MTVHVRRKSRMVSRLCINPLHAVGTSIMADHDVGHRCTSRPNAYSFYRSFDTRMAGHSDCEYKDLTPEHLSNPRQIPLCERLAFRRWGIRAQQHEAGN